VCITGGDYVANISIIGLISTLIVKRRKNSYKLSSRAVRFAPLLLPMILIKFLKLYGRTVLPRDRSILKRSPKK